MSDFAKIFRIDGQQVLVYVGIPSNEDAEVAIHTIFELAEGIQADLVVNGNIEEGATYEQMFDAINEEKVAQIVRDIKADFDPSKLLADQLEPPAGVIES